MRSPFLNPLEWLRRVRPTTVLYTLVALAASAPAWVVRHPPLQDLPFHMATLRQIHNFGDPAYGFAHDYFLNLGSTQYAFYYVVANVFAYAAGVANASRMMMTLYLGGTVLAMRALLLAIGKDERLCLFVVPLLVNMMFLYGLLPFVCGIALMFATIALSVAYIESPSLLRGVWLAVLAVALFFTHVMPFALFGLVFATLFPWSHPRRWLQAAWPPIPSLLAVAWWVGLSAQGNRRRRWQRRSRTFPIETDWLASRSGRSTYSAIRPTSGTS